MTVSLSGKENFLQSHPECWPPLCCTVCLSKRKHSTHNARTLSVDCHIFQILFAGVDVLFVHIVHYHCIAVFAWVGISALTLSIDCHLFQILFVRAEVLHMHVECSLSLYCSICLSGNLSTDIECWLSHISDSVCWSRSASHAHWVFTLTVLQCLPERASFPLH